MAGFHTLFLAGAFQMLFLAFFWVQWSVGLRQDALDLVSGIDTDAEEDVMTSGSKNETRLASSILPCYCKVGGWIKVSQKFQGITYNADNCEPKDGGFLLVQLDMGQGEKMQQIQQAQIETCQPREMGQAWASLWNDKHHGYIINTFKVPDERPVCQLGTGSLVYAEINENMAAAKSVVSSSGMPQRQAQTIERAQLNFAQDTLTDLHVSSEEEPGMSVFYQRNMVTAAIFRGETNLNKDKDGTPIHAIRWYGASSAEYIVCGHGKIGIGLLTAMRGELDSNNRAIGLGGSAFRMQVLEFIPHKDHPEALVSVRMGPVNCYKSIECCTNAQRCPYCPMTDEEFLDARRQLAVRYGLPGSDPNHIRRIFLAPGQWCGADTETGVIIELTSEEALQEIDLDAMMDVWTRSDQEETLPAPFPQDAELKYRGYLAFFCLEGGCKKKHQKFVTRCLYPQLKLAEDVATGSANGMMTYAFLAHYNNLIETVEGWQMAGKPYGPTGHMPLSTAADGQIMMAGRAQLCYQAMVSYNEQEAKDTGALRARLDA